MPPGAILSSEIFLRRRLPNSSFKMALELEKRELRVHDILKDPMYIGLAFPPSLGGLTNAEQDHLHTLLKRAMSQCDDIADIAANIPQLLITSRYYGNPNLATTSQENGVSWRHDDPYTNYFARSFQRAYIRHLPTQDITMLYYLVSIMGEGFGDDYGSLNHGSSSSSDAVLGERVVIFEEALLRHGSWFAWAHIFGDMAWSEMANHIMEVGLSELRSYESGQVGVRSSLKSTIVCRCKELYQCGDDVELVIHETVRRLIKGDDSDE